MSRVVDGAELDLPTACSCGRLRDDARYVGAQQTSTPGDWLLLGNCDCRSTIVLDGVTDASRCCGCGHLILGCDDDPKCCVGLSDGAARIACLDCAPKLLGLREAFIGLRDGQIQLEAMAAGPVRRRSPLSLGEVRAAQGG